MSLDDAMDRARRDFLAECADDYVGLWSVLRRVKQAMPGRDAMEVRKVLLGLLEELLAGGIIVAGMPLRDGTFVMWRSRTAETIEKIEHEWAGLGREPNIGDVVWFTTSERHPPLKT